MRQDALLHAVCLQRNQALSDHANSQADLAVAVAMVGELRKEIAEKDSEIASLKNEVGALTARLAGAVPALQE